MLPRSAENLPILLFFRREKTSALSAPISFAAFRGVSALMKKNRLELSRAFLCFLKLEVKGAAFTSILDDNNRF